MIATSSDAEIHRVSGLFRGQHQSVEGQLLHRFEVDRHAQMAGAGLGAVLLGQSLVRHQCAVVQHVVEALLATGRTCRTKENSEHGRIAWVTM